MAVYFIADTHFDDDAIIRYENRPFETKAAMNAAIIANWNNIVSQEDEVFLVGDVGNASFIKELNGIKYLIKGNHDTLSDDEYICSGFAKVYDYPIIFNDFWIVSHEPLYVNRNMPYANIFGHVHGNPAYKTVSERSYCVSIDRNDFCPISFDDIAMAVAKEDERITPM